LKTSVGRVAALALLASLGCVAAFAQMRTVWLSRNGDTVHVRGDRLGLIAGAPLARLKDGRSVRLELDVATAHAPAGPFSVHARRRLVVSYDLWEERFAVGRLDPPLRSISHLTTQDAEAWCIDQLVVPASTFAGNGTGARLWVRLSYRFEDEDRASTPDDNGGVTLRGLIDRLSRRSDSGAWSGTIVSGPVRID
jgi:hypothetical protein